jgi:hypothetical protein
MKRVFTAWAATEGGEITGFWMGEEPPKTGNGERLWDCVVPLWRIEAGSFEEAMAVYNIRCGYKPYVPLGEAAPCPACNAMYYPGGSAQCWNCGREG